MTRYYREIRTISGQKIWVRETRGERAERWIYWAEVILTPLIVIIVFAAAGGMI